MKRLLLAIAALFAFSQAQALTFEVRNFKNTGEPYIMAWGAIETKDPDEFKKFIKENGSKGMDIYLYSNGGKVDAAQKMAKMIRDMKMNTVIGNGHYCFSACTDMFLGGIERTVFEENEKSLGYHAASLPNSFLEARTLLEVLEFGQWISVKDLLWTFDYITPGNEAGMAQLSYNALVRLDQTKMHKPGITELFDAGVITLYVPIK